jgi:hypothetical protein
VGSELITVYVAHQLGSGPDRNHNRRRAAAWVAWLAERYYCAPVCTWITLAWYWPESMRDLGLEIDRELVRACAAVVLVGPRVSPGMQAEASWSNTVVDLTCPHYVLPRQLFSCELISCDEKMATIGCHRRTP